MIIGRHKLSKNFGFWGPHQNQNLGHNFNLDNANKGKN